MSDSSRNFDESDFVPTEQTANNDASYSVLMASQINDDDNLPADQCGQEEQAFDDLLGRLDDLNKRIDHLV